MEGRDGAVGRGWSSSRGSKRCSRRGGDQSSWCWSVSAYRQGAWLVVVCYLELIDAISHPAAPEIYTAQRHLHHRREDIMSSHADNLAPAFAPFFGMVSACGAR